jgi:hypothetical protein
MGTTRVPPQISIQTMTPLAIAPKTSGTATGTC